MIRYIQKQYAAAKDILPYVSAATGLTALGVSTANYRTNKKRHENDKKYQEKQLNAMTDLTKALNNVKTKITVEPTPEKPKKKKFLRFLQKEYSYTSDYALKGAMIGSGVAVPLSGLMPKRLGMKGGYKEPEGREKWDKNQHKNVPDLNDNGDQKITRNYESYTVDPESKFQKNEHLKKAADFYNKADKEGRGALNRAIAAAGGALIGAALGAFIGAIRDLDKQANKRNVNKRLMSDIISDLKKSGFKEEIDFTRNSKKANFLKTKVCLVISRDSDSLKLVVNTVSDPKLKRVTDDIVKNLPNMSTVNQKASDRFNEINLTTLSSQGDSNFVSSIAERFIREKFPVYLVEVG